MDNEALANVLYGRFEARDIEGMLEHIHDDVEWVNQPKGLHVTGKQELRKLWENPNPAARVEFDIVDVASLEGGMLVTVQERVWMDGQLVFDGPVGHRYTLRGGQIARCDIVDV